MPARGLVKEREYTHEEISAITVGAQALGLARMTPSSCWVPALSTSI